MQNHKKVDAVAVYLEKRKTREYVGELTRKDKRFIFIYDDAYLYKERSIPLGPDLPLTKKKFTSDTLFPSFEDRIPSKKNPAYPEYCKMVGIDPKEKDLLILVATLGRKGPSSFIFAPVTQDNFTDEDILAFRKKLNLTVREFSDLFEFSPTTINRIEKKMTSGKDSLKRLEIYYRYPMVALNEISKNLSKINDEKAQFVENYFYEKLQSK